MSHTRRQFLKNAAFASTALLVPQFLKGINYESLLRSQTNGKTLVVVQLSGGNDGLNTVVPYRNDNYYRSRPSLAIKRPQLLTLNDELGFNKALSPLKSLYDEGLVSIINNVGYPNPNRSHFRSMEIWQTASRSDEYLNTGWLGRYLDSECVANQCDIHNGIEIDSTLSLAMKGSKQKGIATRKPRQLHRITKVPFFQALAKNPPHHLALDPKHHDEDPLSYLYKTVTETASSAKYIHQKAKIYKSKAAYPNHKFGKQLKTVAELIVADIDTSVFYVSLGGFDTHINQVNQQQRLLGIYAKAIKAFTDDLQKNNKLNDVLVLTFSEFGRRVAQNASNGTDHGTANNVFVVGGRLKKAGIYNASPNLSQLDANGDLKYELDFRRVYATILKKWLKSNPQNILNQGFKHLDFI